VLNQAAQTAKRSPEFAASYQTIAKKRGKKIATIAISRKLLTRAWHLLNQMEPADASTPRRWPSCGCSPPCSATPAAASRSPGPA
jgi:hypothetical protein